MSTDMIEDVVLDERITSDIKEPGKYKVIMLNDDQTPMEWVIGILCEIFKHSSETARDITMSIHNDGSAVVGIYTFEIAESKAVETTDSSREHGFPLRVKLEKDE